MNTIIALGIAILIVVVVFAVGALPLAKVSAPESMSCNCATFLTGNNLVTCNLVQNDTMYQYCNCLAANLTVEKQQEICINERDSYYNLTR